MENTETLALIYTTFASRGDAERVGGSLVDDGLAACVNIFPAMTSIYVWKGERQYDSEAAMIIKTQKALVERVLAETKKRHPYETPALLVLDVPHADADYCAWIFQQTEK